MVCFVEDCGSGALDEGYGAARSGVATWGEDVGCCCWVLVECGLASVVFLDFEEVIGGIVGEFWTYGAGDCGGEGV